MDLSKNMPQTAVEISAVGEAAGQLGIKVGKNASNITNFTKQWLCLEMQQTCRLMKQLQH